MSGVSPTSACSHFDGILTRFERASMVKSISILETTDTFLANSMELLQVNSKSSRHFSSVRIVAADVVDAVMTSMLSPCRNSLNAFVLDNMIFNTCSPKMNFMSHIDTMKPLASIVIFVSSILEI